MMPKPLLRLIGMGLLMFLFPSLWLDGQDRLVDQPFFKRGSEAFQSGDFQKAALEFRHSWEALSGREQAADSAATASFSVFEKSVVAARLLESWYRNSEPRPAVAWFREIEDQAVSSREVQKWIALSMLEAGLWDESIAYFESLEINAPTSVRRQMAIYKAHALFRKGDSETAYQTLVPDFADPQTSWDALFYAAVSFETSRFGEAIAFCETASRLPGNNPSLSDKIALLKTKSLFASGRSERAIALLLEKIDHSPDVFTIYSAFNLLQLKSKPGDFPRIEPMLRQWADDGHFPNRQLAAAYYRIVMNPAITREELVPKLGSLIEKNPEHPISHEARIELSSIDPSLTEKLSTIANYPPRLKLELNHHLDFEKTVLRFHEKAYKEASHRFLDLSDHFNGNQREVTLFNSAIAALHEGDESVYSDLEKRLGKEGKEQGSLHADLLFLGGMYYAARSNPLAFDLLAKYTRNYRLHPRIVEGRLALAEMYLNQVPPQPQAAREIFSSLKALSLPESRWERIEYAEIWAELLTPNSNLVPEKTTAFLVKWPRSSLRPQVMMLLATEFFEKRQFQKARETFESIARDFPDSPYWEPALFFAARAASMAVESADGDDSNLESLWEQLITSGGPLSNRARHEKAIDLIRQDRFIEAIRMFDEILQSTVSPSSSEDRFAVECDKGYAQFLKSLAFGSDPTALEEAAATFTKVLENPAATRSWKYQASVRKAKCLELLGREEEALALYRSLVLESPAESAPQIGSSPVEENNWLYRAGFAAMEIMEKNKDWTNAVKLGEILAQRNGTRALEAGRRSENLRLRYFIWE